MLHGAAHRSRRHREQGGAAGARGEDVGATGRAGEPRTGTSPARPDAHHPAPGRQPSLVAGGRIRRAADDRGDARRARAHGRNQRRRASGLASRYVAPLMRHVMLILGIRPDLIRASRVLQMLKAQTDVRFTFVWSGQHYSDNLKDVFFRELDLPAPDIELGATGDTDAAVVGSVIAAAVGPARGAAARCRRLPRRHEHRHGLHRRGAAEHPGRAHRRAACAPTTGGCRRRSTARSSTTPPTVIYTYFPEYKDQGVREGLNPRNIVVIQNLIVDVLDHYYFDAHATSTRRYASDDVLRRARRSSATSTT